MKKRILALALAGTTAFSVFGAAISANAAWTSTDRYYEVDAYMSYEDVAEKITAEYTAATTTTAAMYYYDTLKRADITDGGKEVTSKADALKVLKTYDTIRGNYKNYEYLELGATDNKGYFYIDFTNLQDADLWSTESNESTLSVKVIGTNGLAIYKVSSYVVRNKVYDADSDVVTYTYQEKNKKGEGVGTAYDTLIDLLKAKATASDQPKLVFPAETTGGTAKFADSMIFAEHANTVEDYYENYVHPHEVTVGTASSATSSITVTPDVDGDNTNDTEDWKNWTFNSNMDGEITIEPYKVDTSIVTGGLNIEKDSVPTIYAFDFKPWNTTAKDAATIGRYWSLKDQNNTAASIDTVHSDKQDTELKAETGRGHAGEGIRYTVVSEWIDFLDELAINKDNDYYDDRYFHDYYDEGWFDFYRNYLDLVYDDPQFDPDTGLLVDYDKVDLYNITGLLKDIWALSAQYGNKWRGVEGWDTANTSEMIYLMQQYDKYIGTYIDKAEVASDDWGDLLLSILDAATADDFKDAREYRLYTNRVESLRAAYETATTVGMIQNAEEEMYDLLISAGTEFRSSATAPDKTALNASLKGLYFNVGTLPTAYSINPSTAAKTNSDVEYYNYNYYVAALSVSDPTYNSAANVQNLQFTSTLARGYYSLYPMADYLDYDTTTPNEIYAGNDYSKDYYGTWNARNYATEEYEWFWNVYQLAARMNDFGKGTTGNTKQGSVDAVNDALADAVAELAVTTTPNSTELGAVEDALEEYAGKIESDYAEGYYNKYVQANDYAENIAEGKWQTRIAAMITGVAGEALTYQGTQVTITKNDMKTVETAIKNGETALKAIKEDPDYNAAQVTALNKAIATAEDLVSLYEGTYSTKKDDQSVNKVYTRLVGDKDQLVKSDLTAAIEAIDAAINYSEIVMGWSQNDAGKWMYGTEEGYLNDGWHQVDGGKTWFYFNADGTAKQSEWWNDNGTWYWFNSNCGAATGWAKVDGEWYFFKGNNAMKTGWEKVDGNWYYMASSGKMVTGWCEVNGKWYYFSKESNSLGQMLYSTTVDGYKLGADGAWIK